MSGVRVVQPIPQGDLTTPEIDTIEVMVEGELRHRQRITIGDPIATEGTLSLVRQNQDSQSALLQDLLAALRGTVTTRTEMQERQRAGFAFVASSAKITAPPAGHFRVTLHIPSAGRAIFIDRLVLFLSAGPAYGRLYVNPLVGLPTTDPRPVNNARIGSTTQSPVIMRADVSATEALSGGIDTGIEFGLLAGSNVIELPPLSFQPGATVGLNIPFAGAADAVTTAYWYEE